MARRSAYRRRPDGVLEIRRPQSPLRELLLTAAWSLGGLAVVVTIAAAVASQSGPAARQRAAGPASVCWNWLAGPSSGCLTR